MITIDGSKGEGGGQVIRTSLALSAITGKPFEVQNVRGRRKNAGLARQHLTCVLAAKEICDAETVGAQLRSSHIAFHPQSLQAGDYEFQIGTAGSTSLVAQTVLPALLTCATPSTIRVSGGTHNQMAPPFDFLKASYCNTINQMGPNLEANLGAYGFYPAGGGNITVKVTPPTKWKGISLLKRSGIEPYVTAIVSQLPETIAEREIKTICRKGKWPIAKSESIVVEDPKGPGNVALVRIGMVQVTEVFSAMGEIGVPAEKVANRVYQAAKSFLKSDVPVGPHLADQLMLPMAIAATHGETCRYRTVPLTQHSQTHIDIINRFLDVKIDVTEISTSSVEVRIG